jgi:hypothetical protein
MLYQAMREKGLDPENDKPTRTDVVRRVSRCAPHLQPLEKPSIEAAVLQPFRFPGHFDFPDISISRTAPRPPGAFPPYPAMVRSRFYR